MIPSHILKRGLCVFFLLSVAVALALFTGCKAYMDKRTYATNTMAFPSKMPSLTITNHFDAITITNSSNAATNFVIVSFTNVPSTNTINVTLNDPLLPGSHPPAPAGKLSRKQFSELVAAAQSIKSQLDAIWTLTQPSGQKTNTNKSVVVVKTEESKDFTKDNWLAVLGALIALSAYVGDVRRKMIEKNNQRNSWTNKVARTIAGLNAADFLLIVAAVIIGGKIFWGVWEVVDEFWPTKAIIVMICFGGLILMILHGWVWAESFEHFSKMFGWDLHFWKKDLNAGETITKVTVEITSKKGVIKLVRATEIVSKSTVENDNKKVTLEIKAATPGLSDIQKLNHCIVIKGVSKKECEATGTAIVSQGANQATKTHKYENRKWT